MARVSDSAAGCTPLQSPRPPEALHTTRMLLLFPAFSPRPPLSSNPSRQSPQSHSTPLSAFPELLSVWRSTPRLAPPISPSPVSPLFASASLPLLSRRAAPSNIRHGQLFLRAGLAAIIAPAACAKRGPTRPYS